MLLTFKRLTALCICCCLLLAFAACDATRPSDSGGEALDPSSSAIESPVEPVDIPRDPDISRNAWLEAEIDQLWEEGVAIDREAFKAKASLCAGDKTEEEKLYYAMHALPMRADYPYQEPSDYESIMQGACRKSAQQRNG